MWRLAMKSLLLERGRLATSVAGVGAAMVLVLVLDGIFAGLSEQIVAYPRRAGADVWVMQRGVSNMHMATSSLAAESEARVRAVPGVAEVTPIAYANNLVEVGGREWFSYIVGLDPGAARGGPWRLAGGHARPLRGEAVIPEVVARKSRVGLGDDVRIMGRDFSVVGLSADTFSIANSITFVAREDLAELLALAEGASYLLVKADAGEAPAALAARIETVAPEVHAMTRDDFVASDRAMALQMGADVVRVMTVVGAVVGVLVIGFTIYTATMRRRRELAVVKALGGRGGAVVVSVLLQTLVIAGLGLVAALGLALALRPVVHALVPEVELRYGAGSVAQLAVAALAAGLVASWLPARKALRVDPALVFKE